MSLVITNHHFVWSTGACSNSHVVCAYCGCCDMSACTDGALHQGATVAWPTGIVAMSRQDEQRTVEDEITRLVENWSKSYRKAIYAYLFAQGERMENCTRYDIDKAFKEEYDKEQAK